MFRYFASYIFVCLCSKSRMLSTNQAIDSALKGIVGGAALGGVVGLLVGFRRTPADAPAGPSPSVAGSAVRILQDAQEVRSNSNLHQYLERLLMYNKFGSTHVSTVMSEMEKAQGISNRVTAQEKGTFTVCGTLSAHQSRVIESIRLLRSALTRSRDGCSMQTIADFDDIAAGIQTVCNDNAHNVTMIVQSSMLG